MSHANAEASARPRRHVGVGHRSGLHGHVRFLRRGRRCEVDRDDAPGARSGRGLLRYRRHLRTVHQRRARRPRDPRPSRPGRTRDEVRQRANGRWQVAGDQRPARVRPAVVRRVAQAPRRERDRPLLPAPGRSRDADRRHGRSDGRAGQGRQGPPHRPVGGGAGDDSARARRPSRSRPCRPSTRCGAAIRKGSCSTRAASSALPLSPTARLAAAS